MVSVIEDCGDGWWRAYTETGTGRVPANYFEVLSDNTTNDNTNNHNTNNYPSNTVIDAESYTEQITCWGDILASQKEEKQKLEKQIGELQASLEASRKGAFYFKQFDFLLQEVLKLETEMDLDLDASLHFQRAQLALSRVCVCFVYLLMSYTRDMKMI